MNRNLLNMTISVAVATLAVASASAKADKAVLPADNGIALRIGQFFPWASLARDFEGGHWFFGGIEKTISPVIGDDNSVSVNVYSKGSFTAVPVLLNERFHSGDLFITTGAGLSFIHRIDENSVSFAETQFGWQVGAGYNFVSGKQPMFLEVNYQGNTRPELTGYGLVLGFRF